MRVPGDQRYFLDAAALLNSTTNVSFVGGTRLDRRKTL
jgi:hypothetical protein